MPDAIKTQSKNPKTKYKVLGFTIAGISVAIISYFAFSKLKKEDPEAELPVTPAAPLIAKKKTVKPSSSISTNTSTNTVSPTPIAPASLVATISQATAEKLAEAIRRATYIRNTDDYGKNWGLLLGALGMIKNIKDYTLVNNVFLQVDIADRLIKNAVSMSIVTKTMSGFGQYSAYKKVLTSEFIRIGLKTTPEGKWSLNGLGTCK